MPKKEGKRLRPLPPKDTGKLKGKGKEALPGKKKDKLEKKSSQKNAALLGDVSHATKLTKKDKQAQPSTPRHKGTSAPAHGILEKTAYMDGLMVWINHPTLTYPNHKNICTAVTAAVQAKHGNDFLSINHLTDGGPKATIIRVATEAMRRLLTDHHIGAKIEVDRVSHSVQIMVYRGGGNRLFFLSNCKIFSETPETIVTALKTAYDTVGLPWTPVR